MMIPHDVGCRLDCQTKEFDVLRLQIPIFHGGSKKIITVETCINFQ